MTQPEALRLAEDIDDGSVITMTETWKQAVAAELRRLHAELEREQIINRTNFRKGPSKSICKMLAGGNDDVILALEAALAEPAEPAEPVQEPVACEPQYANDDGWCEWVCPKPRGYLMQCCDCGLIHEVESRVAKYQPRPSEEFEVVDDPDLQVQWRMKRRDDISPKQKTQEPVAWSFEARHIDTAWGSAVSLKHPGPEGVYMRNVVPLYTSPPQRPAEPVQEPVAKVALMMTGGNTGLATRIVEIDDHFRDRLRPGQLLYTAPPQRKPVSVTDLQDALVYTNLIDRDAIDDPDNYDDGSTLAQIDELHRLMYGITE